MRNLINLLRESSDVYSTKGHADMKVRGNDPRFADNPMAGATELDEFDATSMHGLAKLDRLQDMLNDAGVSDQEIKQGVQLTAQGLHKAAAAMGTSPEEIGMLLANLAQHLSQGEDDLEESYYRFVEAEANTSGPFDDTADEDHLSAEPDYLGDITVRSSHTGNERFYQGSKAADITKALRGADDMDQKQAVLRPLVELASESPESGYADEINADAGSYNFPWNLDGRTGFGTAFYRVDGGKPMMKLLSVRDGAGNNVDVDPKMRQELLAQAENFIGDA